MAALALIACSSEPAPGSDGRSGGAADSGPGAAGQGPGGGAGPAGEGDGGTSYLDAGEADADHGATSGGGSEGGTGNAGSPGPGSHRGTGNPYVPGYFADTHVFHDSDGTFYLFSTTDGYDHDGLFYNGPLGTWWSTDFVNWKFQVLSMPLTGNQEWAPNITKGANGRYYIYWIHNGNGCFVASAATPQGPWQEENGGNVVYASMFDTDVFRDTDGSYYLVYMGPENNNARAVWLGKLAANMTSFVGSPKIIYQDSALFEAPGIFKRNGVYYLFYSSGSLSGSYNVRMAKSSAVDGPYTNNPTNPIVESDTSRNILATGHNTVFSVGSDYYIAYHRQSFPRRTGSDLYRQAAVDKLLFNSDGTVVQVYPTETGVGALAALADTRGNLAYHATNATASSSMSSDWGAALAFDEDYGSMWKASANTYPQWLQVDLGTATNVAQVELDFEYLTEAYQYKIEYSLDGAAWSTYVDKTSNGAKGIMYDAAKATARYVKVTMTGSSKTDQSPGVWELKVFGE